ncbi:MAG: pitrilysin family protein [Gammaproteobacteria bacterium]
MGINPSTPVFRIILQGLFLAVWLVAATAHAAPAVQHWLTDKGARVYFVPLTDLPMVDINITFAAGSARDGDHRGAANMTSTLLDKGAGGLSANEIARRIESLGAEMSTGSARDMAWAELRSLSDDAHLAPALAILANVVGSPDFNPQDFERERDRTVVGIRRSEQSPGTVAGNEIFLATYRDHPYAPRPTGTIEDVESLSLAAVKDFYTRYYVARNAVIGIVGDLDRKQAGQLAERLTAGLAGGERAAKLMPVSVPEAGSLKRVAHPSSQSHVRIAAPGVHRGDPDYFPLYVGNHVLGGSGLVSRLSKEVREKRGLSYSVSSYLSPMEQDGPYLFSLQTRNDQVDEALDVMRDNLEAFVEEGPTADELVAAKKNITGGYALRIDSNAKILNHLVMIGFYDMPLDYMSTFSSKVEAVTREQIMDAFKRRVFPARMQTVIVGGAATE